MKSDLKSSLVAVLLVAVSIGLSAVGNAAEISGVQLPDSIKVENKTLQLNGTGLRQATLFKVNVYAGGLYLETPSHDAATILASDTSKSLEMVFMRNVDAKDVSKAWNEGFEKNCEPDCAALQPSLDKLRALMTTDMKKTGNMSIHFLPTSVELIIAGQKVGAVEGKPFSKGLLKIWLGQNPPNEGLKKGLLGIKD